MTYQVHWLIPHRLVEIRFSGDGNLPDLIAAQRDCLSLLEDGRAPVHVLVNTQEVSKPFVDIREMRASLKLMDDSRLGWLLLVGGNAVVRFAITLVAHHLIPRVRLRMVESTQEALLFLNEQDITLTTPAGDAFPG